MRQKCRPGTWSLARVHLALCCFSEHLKTPMSEMFDYSSFIVAQPRGAFLIAVLDRTVWGSEVRGGAVCPCTCSVGQPLGALLCRLLQFPLVPNGANVPAAEASPAWLSLSASGHFSARLVRSPCPGPSRGP